MAPIVLSILIPLTQSRRKVFNTLHKSLLKQSEGKPVEIILDWHPTNNVGKKRNNLLSLAKGEWIVYVDSDDYVSDDYLDKILIALESDPDCVGISGIITTNGKNPKQWHISKSYGRWFEDKGIYYRTPNHISPVRTSIARKVGFPEIKFGEDAAYSKGILRYLKTEVKIFGDLYHYKFISKK